MPTKVAILHYSSPPVVGGVEAVIQAHARLLAGAGQPVTVIAGRGTRRALSGEAEFKLIPEMDSQHPRILQASLELEQGRIPPGFEEVTTRLEDTLGTVLAPFDHVIAHNLFTKHFNLPLTVALCRLLDKGRLRGCIAWCHDFSWSSPHSQPKVHPGFPWDSLRTYRPDLTYVTVSRSRQVELAGLLGVPQERVKVIYNGVDAGDLLGLSLEGQALIERLGLWESDLVMLMPVRVTQAKNIEFAFQVTAALKARGVRPALVITGPPDPHDPSNMEYYLGLQRLRRQLQLEKETMFVYDSGPQPGQPYLIGTPTVGELFRVSDLLFSPSHREGFGMPVLEAGLVGLPVVCANFPAAQEIGGKDVITFPAEASPGEVAGLITTRVESSALHRLRQRIRQGYTWQAIFDHAILPLLAGSEGG
jgi:glycosyltransferase involved in cell wall biosynthesis